jgi:DNA invertase Pin-like site-specific DNA recombinase/predicted DNA-binding transcriptional regulator AlpA
MSAAKITARHVERLAVVYVRQSSVKQVLGNRESTARQYGLAERAVELGWQRERIQTMDSDLGQSAAQSAQGTRRGFDELCRLLALGQVGGVLGIEVSRLARNTVEWFQLLDLCRTHEVAIIEDSNVYLPSRDDDGLILGIQGTLSAAELSVLRARMAGGRRNKALRGALYWRVAAGFVRSGESIRKDPDQRVQSAVLAVFAAFRETGTARQAAALLRERGIELPVRDHSEEVLLWKPAEYSRTLRILQNPAMGGAYAYNFRRGRDRSTPLRAVEERWEILQPEHHEGCLGWQDWLEVQEQLASNHSHPQGTRGPAREGPALLQGVVVCGRCGLGMGVGYNRTSWHYRCKSTDAADGDGRGSCLSAGGKRIDQEVERLFLQLASPAGAAAAIEAAKAAAGQAEAGLQRWELALEQCRYEARLAQRRYRQVDPDNRLVAATLEREWEQAERALQEAEQALSAARAEQRQPPAAEFFADLGADLARVWEAPTTSNADRKRLLGCLLEQVVLEKRQPDKLIASVHWRGGLVEELEFAKIVNRPPPRQTVASTLELIRNLALHYNDRTVARILNQHGRRTAHDLPFSAERVGRLRRDHGIAAHVPTQACAAGGWVAVGVTEAAQELGVDEATLYRWIHVGLVPVNDPGVEGAPLRVRMSDELRARFRPAVPAGFVPVATATRCLGVSRQTIWKRIQAGELASCHVTRGRQRGLYVRLAEHATPSLFESPVEEA